MKRTPLRWQSLARASQNRRYLKLRAEFLTENPGCQFPGGCTERATTIHHTRGRRGWRLLVVGWWKASCWHHNVVWAEDNPTAAYVSGWKVRIEGDGAA